VIRGRLNPRRRRTDGNVSLFLQFVESLFEGSHERCQCRSVGIFPFDDDEVILLIEDDCIGHRPPLLDDLKSNSGRSHLECRYTGGACSFVTSRLGSSHFVFLH
jgi:hypothetical protein